MFQEICLGTPQLPGLLEEAEMSCLYRKDGFWLVGREIRFLALPDPLANTHSLLRVLLRPPASITAFSNKLEAIRGRTVVWGSVGKTWQKGPEEYKEKKYRNRTQPLLQESLHQWRRKTGLAHLRGTNVFFKSTDVKRHQSKYRN